METKTITLGGKEFTVAPMTFDQLAKCAPLFAQASPFTADGVRAGRDLIVVASIDPATGAQPVVSELVQLQTNLDEIEAAVSVIAEVSGMRPLMERLTAKVKAAQQVAPLAAE